MPDSPACPWCGVPMARMMLDQFDVGHDPVPCTRCGKDVSLHMARGLRSAR